MAVPKKTEKIIEETQREAIINRPYNLAGSIKRVKKERFNITKDKIQWTESNTVPALMKLFMEALDNPIDVAIKGGCDSIDIKVNSKSIRIKDNGYGVSTEKAESSSKNIEDYVLYKAFCKYNTSSNYKDNKGKGQKGINGIGIKLCTTLSTTFTVISEDTNTRLKLTAKENNLTHTITELKKTGNTGVEVYFEPDFNIFEVQEIDKEHIDRMYEYTLMQALTYPNINFKFNGKSVKITPKQFIKLLNQDASIIEEDNYFVAVAHSDSGEFRQLSYINGLEISKGGSHIDYIMDYLVKSLRAKISKKYKNIKPSDIKNKLNIVIIGRDMKNIDWEGQVKDTIASTTANIKEYFKDLDLEKFSDKIYKNKSITDSIIDYFKIAEEFKKKQEIDKLSNKKKKIKSDKYIKAVGNNEVLFVCEGYSATSSILPGLGREGIAYYSLKGKPLNAYSSSHQKFTSNTELSELYQIIKTEGFKKIIIASDADVDGDAIAGLLIAFFETYLKEELQAGLLYRINTPIGASIKNGKLTNWVYNLEDMGELKGSEIKYFKGLGSWTPEQLEMVLKKDGIDNMIIQFKRTENSLDAIDDWYNTKKADKRKELILENKDFSITKV